MKAKLIKTEVNYLLEDDKGVVIASTSLKEGINSLCKENCDEIFGVCEQEVWHDIPNFVGYYQVSNHGFVRSIDRVILKNGKHPYTQKGKVLKFGEDTKGYFFVNLSVNGSSKQIPVHKLVANVFLNHELNCKYKYVIDHIDGNPKNNYVSNLRVVSQRVNIENRKFNKSSIYQGVSFSKAEQKWKAYIRNEGKLTHLGYFLNEIDANKAYQFALSKIETKHHSLEIEVYLNPNEKDLEGCIILKKSLYESTID
jgi:hypothetical protein